MNLTNELQIAMIKNSTEDVVSIIDRALDMKYPSRTNLDYHGNKIFRWKATNSDILNALRLFNRRNM